jgi:hypothetical protein
MMFVRSLTLLLVCFSSSASGASLRATDAADVSSLTANAPLFQTWAETHSKQYTTEAEKVERLKIWMDNHGTSHRGISRPVYHVHVIFH